MIIVGYENCETCKVFKQRHPEFEYIEIPRRMSHDKNDKLRQIKLLCGKYKLSIFPLVASDDLSVFISMRSIDPEFAQKHPKLF